MAVMRKRRRFTLDASVDLEPGGTQLLDEAGQLANPGLRAAIWSASITAAEHPEEPVQFDEGFPSRRFDEAEGLCRRLGLARLHRPGRTGLDRDHADVVGHDVVKLARDPRPLLVGGEPPVPIPLTLEPRRPLLELRHIGAPGRKVITNQPGGDEEQAGDRDGEGPGIARNAEDDKAGHETQAGNDQKNQPASPHLVSGDAVHRDQESEPGDAGIETQQDPGREGGPDEQENEARMTSPPEQGNDLHQQQGQADKEGEGHASWSTQRETRLSFGESKVEDGIDQSDREEEANQQPIEGARLQPSDPTPPARARFHWLQGSHPGRETNQPRE